MAFNLLCLVRLNSLSTIDILNLDFIICILSPKQSTTHRALEYWLVYVSLKEKMSFFYLFFPENYCVARPYLVLESGSVRLSTIHYFIRQYCICVYFLQENNLSFTCLHLSRPCSS